MKRPELFILAVLGCIIVAILVISLFFKLMKDISQPEEAARICVFSETEVWCIYPKEYNND